MDKIKLKGERLKDFRAQKRALKNFEESFGDEFGLHWFLPIARISNPPRIEELYY